MGVRPEHSSLIHIYEGVVVSFDWPVRHEGAEHELELNVRNSCACLKLLFAFFGVIGIAPASAQAGTITMFGIDNGAPGGWSVLFDLTVPGPAVC